MSKSLSDFGKSFGGLECVNDGFTVALFSNFKIPDGLQKSANDFRHEFSTPMDAKLASGRTCDTFRIWTCWETRNSNLNVNLLSYIQR